MKKIAFYLFLFPFFVSVSAQDPTVRKLREDASRSVTKPKDQPDGWFTKGLLNVNLSQGSTSNWSSGADKFTFATNLFFNYQAFYKNGRDFFDNNVDVNYGMVNASSTGFRKNDDRFDLISKYGRQIDTSGVWFLSLIGNLRTQLTDGYRYFKTAAGADTSELASTFMAPATLLLSPGLEYRPNSAFNIFFSPTSSRWVIVSRQTDKLGRLYGVDSGRTFRYEIGGFLTANFSKSFLEDQKLSYKARLDLYSNYRHNPLNVDVFFTNLIALKVSEWLQVTYNLDIIYDDDALKPEGQRWGTQIKSLLGVGFAAKF